MKFIITLILLCILSLKSFGQIKYSRKEYTNKPMWIQMMNDTSVNYFETVKAFRIYFKRRPLPKEPNEVEGTDRFEIEVGLENEEDGATMEDKIRERTKEKIRQEDLEARRVNRNEPSYSAEVRAFRGWFYSIKPWVKADGRIIGPKERQAIIDNQRRELSNEERANRKN